MGRLFYYGSVCAALPVLRAMRNVPAAKFRLPLGRMFSVLAVATSLLLFPRLDRSSTAVLAVIALCVALNSLWPTGREAPRERAQSVPTK